MRMPPPEVQAAAQAALRLAEEGKITLPRGSKAKRKKEANAGPRKGSHAYKIKYGSTQRMSTNRQRRRNGGGVVHVSEALRTQTKDDLRVTSAIQRAGQRRKWGDL